MIDRIATVGLLVVSTFLLVVGISVIVRRLPRFRPLTGALLVLGFNFGMIGSAFGLIPQIAPVLGLSPQFNWQGKVLALATTLALIRIMPGLSRREVGLVWVQRAGSLRPAIAFAAIVCLSAWLTRLVLGRAFHAPDPEAFLFQATLPGLDEEIVYRGILFLLLLRAFGHPNRSPSVRWSIGLAISIVFGLAHGLSYSDGGVRFQPVMVLMTGGLGVMFFWLKERTNSLVLPIITHNVINVGFQFL